MKKFILFYLIFAVIFSGNLFSQNQNVSINNSGDPAHSSAMLDISSNSKGLLIPRMSANQRDLISSPATGLVVFVNDDDNFWYFNGSSWTVIGGSGGSGATISGFSWNDASDLLEIIEDGTPWQVTIDNEADDLSDNLINDLSNVNAIPTGIGQVLKWDGTQWYAGTDEAGSGGTVINTFSWDDGTNLLRITEGTTNWDVYINNEADDLSNNVINDLSNVNASPSNGDFLQWNGTEWIAGSASGGSCTTLDEAYDCGGAGLGRLITVDAGSFELSSTSEFKPLLVSNSAANSFAISAEHTNSGVTIGADNNYASSQFSVIQATTVSTSNSVSAIFGSSSGAAWGITGEIESTGTASAGVQGSNLRTDGGHGVYGIGVNGIVGETNRQDGYGVYGINNCTQGSGDGPGVYGLGFVGVYGQTNYGQYYGVLGENLNTGTTYNNIGVGGWGWVGVFGQTSGGGFGVYADGDLGSSGTKSFVIDHPLDPSNKTLKHFCAESPEVLNIYRGNVELDLNGEATVILPDYFSSININFSYYLTPVGGAAPNLHVSKEVEENKFSIAGGTSGLKVSWVIYAERNDLYMQTYPGSSQVEVDKRQPGTYIRPELYNQPADKGIFNITNNQNHDINTSGQVKQNILQ